MDFKKVLLLVGALMVAAVTAIMARNMFAGAGAKQAVAAPVAVPTGPKVLVAAKDLPVGTILDQTSLKFVAWPKESMQDSYYAQSAPDSDPSKLAGTVVRYPITAGQPVTRGSLVGPEDRGFLAAALSPGMRAVTVPVTATSGLAGFVFPGDHVDIVLTESVNGSGDQALKVSETILRNVRVLATDQRYTDKDTDGKVKVQQASNVTLEVTPKIAEKIAVAQSVGSLSLSLRSLSDTSSDVDQAVASGSVKIPAGTSPDAERQMLNAFANRPIDTDTTFTTGGDVSRFQPRTVQKAPAAGGSAPAYSGPVVRIARGNDVSVVPVGVR
jgi:pilus assembly protein CpaB